MSLTVAGKDELARVAAQNLADIDAMGGRPSALVASVVAPRDMDADVFLDVVRGLGDRAREAGAGVVGGDLSAGEKLVISITAFGYCPGPVVRRDGACPGDLVAVSGTLGYSYAGLDLLEGGHVDPSARVDEQLGDLAPFVDTYRAPRPPLGSGVAAAAAGARAMMDLSVHTIDLMEYITGMRVPEVASMNEKIAFPEPQYDVEDTSTILMRMENGAQCVVQSNFNIPDEASKWRVEFFGTKGRLLGDTMIGQIDGGKLNAVFIDKNVAYSAEQTHADDAGSEIPGDFGNMYTREIESFSDSILNDKPLVVPASDAVHVQRIMEKAYASGEELKILKI